MQNNNQDLSSGLDMGSHRRSMYKFVWFVVAALFISSNLIPLAGGVEPPMPVQIQFVVLCYLAICFVLSSWYKTRWITPHLLLLAMTLLFTYLCIATLGINAPISHFLPLIPALASLLLPAKYSIAYGLLVSASIGALLILGPAGELQPYDIQNGATLVLSTIVVTAGCYYVALFDERLIKAVKGKSGYDELTSLPNRYFLRNQYQMLTHEATEGSGEKTITLINFGIDGFVALNKVQGNQAGDSILVEVAHTLSSLASRTNTLAIARSEGTTFTVIFAGHSLEQAQAFVQKTQQGFDALKIANTSDTEISLSAVIMPVDLLNSPPPAIELLTKANYLLTMGQSYGNRHIQVYSDFYEINSTSAEQPG